MGGYIFATMVDLNTETKEITEFKKRSPSWPGSYKPFYGFIYFQSRISFTALMDLFRAAPMYRRNK
ncbi:hypothetical protein AN963_07830 [Brevibacillus choshinensis]|uniref:Uncharacterized protein n=1 Tax=Brevibacillus choshinensis TaxID=54911 RepID=A0ABR5NDJ5_BRECH|nr:hypothetical protein AN963_07830 [Brevibacillus choshinensis]